jgi:hypothetical protein
MSLDALFETAGAKIPGFAESKEKISYERRKPKKATAEIPFRMIFIVKSMFSTFLSRKRPVRAAVRKRNISATTSPKNLNINRRSFLLINMFVRNTHAPRARIMVLQQRQCLLVP